MSSYTKEQQLMVLIKEEPVDVFEDKVTTQALEDVDIKEEEQCYDGHLSVKTELQVEDSISFKDEEDQANENLQGSLNENPQTLQPPFNNTLVKDDALFCKNCNTFFDTTESEVHKCTFGNNSISSNRSVSDTYSCDICNKSFSQKGNLNKHMHIHTGYKPLECKLCKKSFFDSSHLKRHMRTHTGHRPFKCTICTMSFSDKSHYKRHMNVHTGFHNGVCPYSCDICNKSFSQKGNLHKHMHIHTGYKPLECKLCKKSFFDTSHLKRHMRTHTSDRPFKCTICTMSFSDESNYKRHMNVHTGFRPVKCCVCAMTFQDQSNCDRHMLYRHRPDFVLMKHPWEEEHS